MKKTKIFTYALAIIIVLLSVQCADNHKRLNKELTKRAAELNLSTPVALEKYTRFDSVGVSTDNVFQYFYTVTNIDNPKELLANNRNDIIENMDKVLTTDPALLFFIKNKVTMEYIYRDTMRNVIDVITIETDKYKR